MATYKWRHHRRNGNGEINNQRSMKQRSDIGNGINGVTSVSAA